MLSLEKEKDGSVYLNIFNKRKFLYTRSCKYTEIFSKRLDSLTREELRYLLEIQFEVELKYKPNLDNPKTLDEKIQWLKFNYHDPLMTKCADKVKARDYIKEKIGEQYLVPSLGVYNSVEEIDFAKLPNRFALKVNWGCKENIVCENKSKLDIKKAKKQLKNWLKKENNHYYNYFEWQYKNIEPKILCEEYVDCGPKFKEYKLFCFNGKMKFISTVENIGEDCWINFFDTSLKKLPFRRTRYPDDSSLFPDTNNYHKMVELAEELAKPFPLVRVDFYEDINKKIRFGELTFTPSNGHMNLRPQEWNYKLGEYLVLPKIKI